MIITQLQITANVFIRKSLNAKSQQSDEWVTKDKYGHFDVIIKVRSAKVASQTTATC